MALLQEAGNIDLGGVQGEAGHGDGVFFGPAAAGEGDIQGLGGAMGILEKKFVKIPHLEQEQTVGMLGLDIQILPQHGGDFVGGGFGHGGYCISKAGGGGK